MDSIGPIPIWALALVAFGLQFWLFCLLPCWVNKDADVLEHEDMSFDGAVPVRETAKRRNHSP